MERHLIFARRGADGNHVEIVHHDLDGDEGRTLVLPLTREEALRLAVDALTLAVGLPRAGEPT
ncbi:hypothetical protein [Emcibacter sp. SYSU 3D8]|uniref:hypothetical protein n=1 Tax=Emcibacter sp. SYSU 3D8 TaxID=3133969 RepID=UPI0031FE71BD